MCRVLLVDDEKMARIGIRSVFDWENGGYELVGEASNGQKALKWIENGEADILITDIAMPVMDGLELTRIAKARCPWIKVLLLSCHSDFEYVREGIRLGASDYILKPTLTAEALKTALDRMRAKQEEEREERRIIERFKDQKESEELKELEKSLCKALCGHTEAMARMKAYLADRPYRMLVCGIDAAEASAPEDEDALSEQGESLRRRFGQLFPGALTVQLRPDTLLALVPAAQESGQRFREQAETFLERQEGAAAYPYSLAASRPHSEVEKLRQAYTEAKKALALAFFTGPGRLHLAEQRDKDGFHGAAGCREKGGSDDESGMSAMNALKEALTAGFRSKAERELDAMIARWTPGERTRTGVMREAEELLGLFALCKGAGAEAVRHICELSRLRYKADIERHIRNCFHELWSFDDNARPNRSLHERIVMQALQYIDEHYTESISLQQVADWVCVSRNYFSEMFKRVTGQNFIDYLIALRLKRAKELLRNSSLRVYEVAEQSGFNDVKYFSKQFKKTVGMTPAEYQGLSGKGRNTDSRKTRHDFGT